MSIYPTPEEKIQELFSPNLQEEVKAVVDHFRDATVTVEDGRIKCTKDWQVGDTLFTRMEIDEISAGPVFGKIWNITLVRDHEYSAVISLCVCDKKPQQYLATMSLSSYGGEKAILEELQKILPYPIDFGVFADD